MTNRRSWTPLLATMRVVAISLKSNMETGAQDSSCPDTWTCYPTMSAPTLDADLAEWESVEGITTALQSITGTKYEGGEATLKCMYDNQSLYFAYEFRGAYRYNSSSDELCAAIETMTKVGVQATLYIMGGCADAMSGCSYSGTIPDTCVDYVVDIGAHWQLPSTENKGIEYGLEKQSVNEEGETQGVVDKFAASPYCRVEDKDSQGTNDWHGAWMHTNPTEGMDGTYIFELSRPLTTTSSTTDAQYVAGETYNVGVAFWDPFETEEGWTDPGHYVTGCANQWIELQLATSTDGSSNGGGSETGASGSAVNTFAFLLSLICIAHGVVMI